MIRLALALGSIWAVALACGLTLPHIPTPQEMGRLYQTAHVTCDPPGWCR